MCGICGLVGEGSYKQINNMTSNIRYRGPDDQNIYIDESNNVFLGHTRLSIIDIENGSQPMISENKNIVLLFNGEIYNHKDLRKFLNEKKTIFKSKKSDTEIILKLYEYEGIEFINRLNGMFSISIYDKSKNKIFLIRDRFGEKPLFYSKKNKSLIFSSSMEGLFKFGEIKKSLNKKSLHKYYAYGFIPGSYTIFNEINKLEGGHYIEYEIKRNKISLKRYWQYRIDYRNNNKSYNYFKEELEFLLQKSVKERMDADVPIGVLFSGGIDSSLITYYAHLQKKNIETFSIGFNEKSFDEIDYINYFKNYFNILNVNEILTEKKMHVIFEKLLKFLDEPIADPSLIPTHYACNLASEKVKVVLTGDGADELFCGYNTFDANILAQIIRKMSNKGLLKFFYEYSKNLFSSDEYMSFNFKLNKFLYGINHDENMQNPLWISHLELDEINEYLKEDYSNDELYEEAITSWENSSSDNIIDKTSEFYVNFYLKNNIVSKSDKSSMFNSIENRSPFLDYKIVDLASRMPYQYKYKFRKGKRILKDISCKFLPKKITQRNKKGFAMPISKWIKNISLDQFPKNDKYFNHNAFKRYYSNHSEKKRNYYQFLWGDYTLKNYLIKMQ